MAIKSLLRELHLDLRDSRLQNCVKQTVATKRISWGKDICSEDHTDPPVVLER